MKTAVKVLSIMVISALLGALMAFSAPTKMKKSSPDFAFPKKVATVSLSNLELALKTDSGPLVVESLINYALAEVAVDRDSVDKVIDLVDTTRGKVKEAPVRALLSLLEARIYSAIYEDDRWKYDERTLPLEPLPANCLEWSGEQFKERITSLVNESLSEKDALREVPLRNYKNILEADRYTYIYYPTLLDFVSWQGIEICSGLAGWGNLYSAGGNLISDSAPVKTVDRLYKGLIEAAPKGSAPYVKARLGYLSWINRHSESSDEDNYMNEVYKLFDECRDSEYSGDILQTIAEWGTPEEKGARERLYNALTGFLKKYPAYYGNNCLRNSLNELLRPLVRVNMPVMAAPGSETEFTISVENAREFSFAVYSIPSAHILADNWLTLARHPHKLVSRITRSVDLKAPFDTTLTVKANVFPKEGYYVVVPELSGVPVDKRDSYPVIYCTRGALAFIGLEKSSAVALDPLTGAPISGAVIMYSDQHGNNRIFSSLGKTDKEGFFPFSDKREYGSYGLKNGTDFYTPTIYYFSGYGPRDYRKTSKGGEIFTALPIYRPGDTVNFAAVAYTNDRDGRHPMADSQLSFIVYDVNRQPVDTITATTDAFGRIEGEFVVPEGRLTGRYQLSLTLPAPRPGKEGMIIAGSSVMISDYKLPSFKVEVEDILLSTPAKGEVTIKGRVATYSGFGMSDATLSMRLSVSRSFWWWRSLPSQEVMEKEITVGDDGRFEVVIDRNTFEHSPYPKGSYTALFTATSPSGESQTASRSFAMGEAYTIKANIPSSLDVTRPVRLDVKVFNAENKPADASLQYILYKEGSDSIKGTLNTSDPTVNLSRLTPGTYSLTLVPQGDIASLCDIERYGSVAIYRPDVDKSPSENPLWAPKSSFTAKPGEKVRILYGTPGPESHILLVIQADDKTVEKRWLHETGGLHTLEVVMPEAMKAVVSMMSTCDYKSSQLSFVLSNPITERKLKVERESFRDRLVPGTDEKWIIKVSSTDGSAASSAVIVDMYNRALEAIAGSVSLKLSDPYYRVPRLNWNSPQVAGTTGSAVSGTFRYLKCPSVMTPDFNLYGRSLYQGRVMYKTMLRSSRGITNDEVVMEEAEMAMAAPTVAYGKVEATADAGASMANGADDLANVEEDAEELKVTEAQAEGQAQAVPEFEYRDAETPLAFFRPMLTTDSEGRLSLEFTVPNANAAWSFNALAWTDEMVTGSSQADVTSSKPVMVQPNLPRFLRTGDEAVLQAMVMNNSDEAREVTTVIEIFDPAAGKEIQQPVTVSQSLASNGSGVAEVSVKVPDGVTMIGYRVKSVSGDFADGEQTAIPVLAASQPVIETSPFYIAPDDHEFELRLPKIDKEAKVTLQFCENPAWYVVTALPGLSSEKPRTAVDAAVAIFSTAVAEGIIKTNPRIASAIKEWNGSQRDDSTLVSMLERNQDLKTVLLQATPWMMDARSDTERMERLVLLFDSGRCKKAVDEAIQLLADLQQPDGGWGWTPQFRVSSTWITYLVLDKMGGLLRLKFLPDDSRLKEMIEMAVKYTDNEVTEMYRKYPESDYRSYTTMRDLFPGIPQSSEAKHVSEVTVQRMLKKWKDYSVEEKAFAAMTFYVHGYKNVSREVLSSLREYSVYDPAKGMWWPSEYGGSLASLNIAARILDAIILIESESIDIDRIRQWLIFEKEARNWGDGATATAVIGSFLAVSDRWIAPAQGCEIKVGNRLVEPESVDKTLGYFRTDISALKPSGALLKVAKPGDTPAWGAVYARFTSSMDDIKAESCDAVRIEKRISVVDGSSDALKVGDRVMVQLIITTSRTMDYVAVTDERAACLAPVDQTPGYVYAEGVGFYRENLDSSTRLFIGNLPKGTYILTYDMFVSQAGRFSSGIATIQSQYAPAQTAHSASAPVTVSPK